MNLDDIAVRVIGPGSQEEGDERLEYMRMPSGMSTYVPPSTPEPAALAAMAGARETINWLRDALAGYAEDHAPRRANLSALDEESRNVVNQILGEGEVSVTCEHGPIRARTQESVLAGIWRTFLLDEDDAVVADILEVGEMPLHVEMADFPDDPLSTSREGVPDDMTNAMSILVELTAHLEKYAADRTQGIVNLTLLPLSETEVEFLDERLGRGPVDILSRAYGKCQIIRTRSRNVWWVRYYNSMSTLILNTLEIVDVPQVVRAAPEDLSDSAERLEQILAPYDLD